MKPIVLIPAKAVSTRCPEKNWRPFAGGPSLTELALTVADTLVRLGHVDRVILSTDRDDVPISDESWLFDLECVKRPPRLRDTMQAVADHAFGLAGDVAVQQPAILLQPSSPLRSIETVIAAIRHEAPRVISVVQGWSWECGFRIYADELEPLAGYWLTRPRTQDAEPSYWPNGDVYKWPAGGEIWGPAAPIVCDPARSISIDTEADWARAEALYLSWRESATTQPAGADWRNDATGVR